MMQNKRAPRALRKIKIRLRRIFSADVTGTHLRATGHCPERPLLRCCCKIFLLCRHQQDLRPPLPQTEDQIASSAAMSPRSHASGMSGGRSHVSLISAPGVAFAAQAGSTTADRRPGADSSAKAAQVGGNIPTNIAPAQHPFQAAMPPAAHRPQIAVSGSAKKQAADGGLVSSGTALPDTADTRPDQGQEPNVLTQSSSSDVFFERIPTPSHNYVAIEQAEEMLREMELKYKKDQENMDGIPPWLTARGRYIPWDEPGGSR